MFLTPFSYLAAFADATRTAQAAATTIAARSMILWRASLWPGFAFDPEIPRMVSEKITAAVEGMLGAQREMAGLALSAMSGAPVAELVRKTVSVGEAGFRPARRRVRANARRLTRKS